MSRVNNAQFELIQKSIPSDAVYEVNRGARVVLESWRLEQLTYGHAPRITIPQNLNIRMTIKAPKEGYV